MAQLNPDTTSALAPPEGVRADFENPYCQAGAVYAAQSILLGVASLILAARIYTKALLMKQLGCDDYALVLGWASTVLKHRLPIRIKEICLTEQSPQNQYIGQILYCIEILFVKLGALFQLRRIFFGTKKNMTYWLLTSLIVINTTFYFIAFFIAIFQCRSIDGLWDQSYRIVEGRCLDMGALIIGTAGFNVAIDFLMLVLPLYSISQIMISTKRKLGIGAVFATGILATVASALRLAYSIQVTQVSDITFKTPDLLWAASLEVVSIIVAASIPVMPRLFKHMQGRDRTQAGGDYRNNVFQSATILKNQRPGRTQLKISGGRTPRTIARTLTRTASSSNLGNDWVILDDFQPQHGKTSHVSVGSGRASSRTESVLDLNSGVVGAVDMV
ncbi:hypothetical protein MMC10_011121 [Thelotrema lepadinum]|nr:hypothetical protein [Thelotrema lepadinum]